jgi:tetratricopeptide (TPR) repeat protein
MMTLDEHPELEQTHALADGELTGEALERAQDHLATCEHCQAELADVMQMKALPMPQPANVISLAWYRKRSTRVAGVLVAAAAAATVLYLGGHRHAMTTSPEAPVKIALADTRALEARLSWQGAADYRAYSVPRGSSLAKEPISLAAMADAEKRGDLQGVAALALLGGDFEQAKKYLALAEKSGESADVLADHAALELSLGAPDKALALADHALEKSPDAAVATWNRALALRDLGLRHDAAEAFRAVAKRGERGWAMEATKRADELERSFKDELELTKRVWAAATPLAQTQTGLAIEDARRLPATARIELYDALRTAPDAQAVAKLLPLAEAIDSAGGDHSTVDAVKAAKPDPKVSAAYLSILTDPKPDRTKLLATLRAAHANDALAVALIKLGDADGNLLPADLPELVKLSQASSDPWIQLLGIEQRGLAALVKNDLPTAEAALLPGRDKCKGAAPSYRCMKIAMALGRTYLGWQRLPEAQTALLDAWRRAFALLAVQQDEILPYLTDVATISDDNVGGGLPLVRAYTSELAARAAAQNRDAACDIALWGHQRVATVLQVQLRFEEAKRELADPAPCSVSYRDPSAIVTGPLVRSMVLHVIGTPAEIAALRADIAKVREKALPPGPRAILDHAEGRVAIGVAPEEGVKLLRRAINTAKETPLDGDSQRAIGMSYALLAIHAARTGEPSSALKILGEELGVEPRATCVLGVVGDDRDTIVIARGASGQTSAVTSSRNLELVATKVIGKETLASLEGCKDIDVIARPPYNGMSRLMPDDLAWRYVSPRPHATTSPSNGSSLVVADVEPPASLGLPRLASWSSASATTLIGPAATPGRVLAAIGEARDVTIHAHGFADEGDASYLALSPDANGQYALTAREVSRAKLSSAPLVILAACETAKAAPQFATRWSLPIAFLSAGARAVVAPTTAVPDQEAGPFFDEVRTRAAAGVPLAEVVRDLRKQWLADRNADWVRDVVVFE